MGLGQRELADRAAIGIATLQRIEAALDEITGTAKTISQIQKALEAAGVVLLTEIAKVVPEFASATQVDA